MCFGVDDVVGGEDCGFGWVVVIYYGIGQFVGCDWWQFFFGVEQVVQCQ